MIISMIFYIHLHSAYNIMNELYEIETQELYVCQDCENDI